MSEQSYYLTLTQVAQSVRLTTETLVTIVDLGIVEPRGEQPNEWLFEPRMLETLRCATRLRRDLELEWEAIALAVRLIEQNHALRADNNRLRRQLSFLIDADSGDYK